MASKKSEAHSIASGRLREIGQNLKTDLDSKQEALDHIAQEMKELQAVLTLAESLDPSASAKELTNMMASVQAVNTKIPEVDARLETARMVRDTARGRYDRWVRQVLQRRQSIDFLKTEISHLREQISWHEEMLAGARDIPRPRAGALLDAFDEMTSRGGFYDS
jgi:chromosome segregation ATPase